MGCLPLTLPVLIVIKNGALWLTSSRGLMRFNPKTKRVRVYSINDGLLSQEFTQRAPFLSNNGQAIVLNNTGLISFNPRSNG